MNTAVFTILSTHDTYLKQLNRGTLNYIDRLTYCLIIEHNSQENISTKFKCNNIV